MKIAIIGAGFTGLAAAYQLTKEGHDVSIFEKDPQPGGLALGYKKREWDWTLENYYHHWFTNDNAILSLAKEINYPVLIKRPRTCVYIGKESYQLDSPLSLLQFPKLPFWDKLRMAETLAILRFNPFWKDMEKVKATSFLPRAMGEKAYKMIWEPLFVNKFGDFADSISLAWFWARITKRTPSLAYPEGGFLRFAKAIEKKVTQQGGTFFYNSSISRIEEKNNKTTVTYDGKKETFDAIIVTIPSFYFLKITPQLPEDYTKKLSKLQGIGAMTAILRLKKSFLKDKTYWLNVCDPTAPITAVVEHTHFMDKKHYNNEHILYLGNYLPTDHPYYSMSNEQLMQEFDPFLEELHPGYKKDLIGVDVFRVPFAQPIITTNYSKVIPPFTTPLPHVFLANMQQVYPWDRGTNYAVALGEKIAKLVTHP